MSLSHRRARKWIQARANGQLTAAQEAELAGHLAGCEACQGYAAELEQLEAALYKELPERWPRPEAWNLAPVLEVIEQKRERRRWGRLMGQTVRLAAGAAVLVVVGIVMLSSGLFPQEVALRPSGVEPAAEFVAEQEIAAACQVDNGTYRYRFDEDAGEWEQGELIGLGEIYVGQLPEDELYARVQGGMWDVRGLRLADGRPLTFEGSAAVDGAWPLRLDPSGKTLLLDQFASRDVPIGVLADLTCTGEDCPLQELTGMPVWSPDGGQTLVVVPPAADEDLPFIFLGDADGRPVTSVIQGVEPFWLGADVYGYITAADDGAWMLEVVFVQDGRVYQLTSAQFQEVVPVNAAYRPLQVLALDDQSVLMVMGSEGTTAGPYYVAQVDVRAERYGLLGEVEGEPFGMQVSPDGRWVGVQTEGRNGSTLYLLETSGDERLSVPADYGFLSAVYWEQAWSADGEELIVIAGGRLGVVGLETGVVRELGENGGQCTTGWWE